MDVEEKSKKKQKRLLIELFSRILTRESRFQFLFCHSREKLNIMRNCIMWRETWPKNKLIGVIKFNFSPPLSTEATWQSHQLVGNRYRQMTIWSEAASNVVQYFLSPSDDSKRNKKNVQPLNCRYIDFPKQSRDDYWKLTMWCTDCRFHHSN